MVSRFQPGDKVQWNWGSGTADGEVKEVFARRVQRTIKGKQIVRNGSEDTPAYLVLQEDGDQALKLQSELHPRG
jgi:hypothetical protein